MPEQKPPYLVPVQINVRIPYAYRAHLQKEAERKHVSLNQLVVDALRTMYPHTPSRAPSQSWPKPDDDDPPDRDHLEWT